MSIINKWTNQIRWGLSWAKQGQKDKVADVEGNMKPLRSRKIQKDGVSCKRYRGNERQREKRKGAEGSGGWDVGQW